MVRAPEPHIILGVASNLQISPEAWKAFVGEAPNATAVYQQVANEFAKMNGVLEEYSELACDWQVLIDSQGTFYHMDLDRMTESRCDHKSWYRKRYE